MKTEKKAKPGRPAIVDWKLADKMWKTKTVKQIAEALGTSYSNVFMYRRNQIVKLMLAGKTGAKFQSNKPKWARAPKVDAAKKVARKKAAKELVEA